MANWTEETKNTIPWIEEIADWFYNGWFFGWFSAKSTPTYIEETKNTIPWIEETK